MFSEFIQKKLEARCEKLFRDGNFLEHLAGDIFERTNFKISSATLEAFFGMHSQRVEPALFTLEVLACYLGYMSSAQMRADFNLLEFKKLKPLKANSHMPYTSICVSV
jgi:hypothetical protein